MGNRSTAFSKEKKWPTNTWRLIQTLQKIYQHYHSFYDGELTLMFNNNKLAVLENGKLKETTSLSNLEKIIN